MAFDPTLALASLFELGLALLFGLATVWVGVRVFDAFTPGLDEMAELKRGNLAVGLTLGAVVLSVAIIVRGAAGGVAAALAFGTSGALAWLQTLGLAFLQLFLALLLAMIIVRLALWAFDQVTQGIDDESELARGNLALAAMLSGVLVGVAHVTATAIGAVVSTVRW